MAQKLFYTDGAKAVNLIQSDDPDVWNFFSGRKTPESVELYARVAAAFTAVNKVSRAVASMPFVVMKGKTEVDNSADWQNVLGFMPNPRDLLRRVSMSVIMSNMGYLRMGKNTLGMPKRLHYVTQPSITVITDPITGELVRLDRMVNGRLEKSYKPDDNELIRFWWLDDQTELLPTANTEFRAITNAAGVLFWADSFTKLYFQRGGVKPTLIAMKGMISKDKTEDMQRDWTTFVRGIGQGVKNIAAKIFNAEAMDIKPFGEGLGDLKETPVFRQALENIAIGLNMPISILLSNAANYATAEIDQRQFYRDNIIPRFDFLADCLNEQLLIPLGYRIENRAETEDAQQEEEVQRQTAASGFGDVFTKYPSYELLVESLSGIFGYELPEAWLTAAKKYYADKKVEDEKLQAQMEQNPPAIQAGEEQEDEEPKQQPPKPKAWLPTIDHLEELRIWRDVAMRKFRKAEPLDFVYEFHKGGLPPKVTECVKSALLTANSMEAVKQAFDMGRLNIRDATTITPAPAYNSDLVVLAQAMNKMADSMGGKSTQTNEGREQVQINIKADNVEVKDTEQTKTLEAMKATLERMTKADPTPAPIVNVNVDPTPVKIQNVVNVPEQPAPVVNVTNKVAPAPVTVVTKPNHEARVIRGRDGKIERLEAE